MWHNLCRWIYPHPLKLHTAGPAEAYFFGQAIVKISVDNGCRGGS